MENSIIRRGNHFIKTEEAGWVLIDGPWFKYLEQIDRKHVRVFAPVSPAPCYAFYEEKYPRECTYTHFVWERIRWHPGTTIPKNVWRKGHIYDYLSNRVKYGWVTMTEGKLPCYLNRLEPAEHRLDYELMQMEARLFHGSPT